MNNNNGGNGDRNNPPHSRQNSHQNSPVPTGNTPPASDGSNGGGGGAPTYQQQQPPSYQHQQEHGGGNAPDQQLQNAPHQQHRYPQRDGQPSVALLNLPPGTRIQSMTADVSAASQQQQQEAVAAAAAIYNQQQYYQPTVAANTSSGGYIHQTGYGTAQMQPGQYYTPNNYYPNPAGGYAVAPQALIMQPGHQTAAYPAHMLNQSHPGMQTSHGHQIIATSGGLQQSAGTGIMATSHLQQGNVVVSSSGGAGAIPTSVAAMAPPAQAPKQRRILQFVDPNSGEALKFGSEAKPAASANSAAASDEENKSTAVKSEFLKRVSERVKDETGAVPTSQRRSPSFAGRETPQPAQQVEQYPQQQMDFIVKSASGSDLRYVPATSPTLPESHHYHHSVPSMAGSMPIPIEHHQPPIHHHHSPHNLPSILEIKVSQPSPHKEEAEERPPSFNAPTPTINLPEEKKMGSSAEMGESKQPQQPASGGGEKRNHVSELIEQELNGGGQSPTPTEGAEEASSPTEDKFRELEEEMHEFDGVRNDTHDPDAMIYSRSFLMFLRKVTHAIKTVKCPKTEEELEELGLSKKGMPISQFSSMGMGGKTKRFDMSGSDSMFKPSWQQPGGGGGGGQFGGGAGGRFSTTRAPYAGRHSDNKLKPKKQMVGRPSLDQRPIKLAQVSQQAENLPRKSANAWKTKREERFDINAPNKDEEDLKYEKIKKEVRGLLNKITPSTYEELTNDFCAYKINEDPKLLAPIIDLIFDKAVEEPHFCPLYSDLCKKQVNIERQLLTQAQRDKTPDDQQAGGAQPPKKTASFRNEIIIKCQRTFLASDAYDSKMKELDEKLKEEKDGKSRTQIEDEIESRRMKEKRRLLGIIKFIGQLYRHQLVVEMIIDWCAVELIKRFQVTNDEVYIEYAVELVETVGKIYEQRTFQMQSGRQPAQQRTAAQVLSGGEQKQEYRLDMVFSHLSQLKPSVSNRVRFAIMDLEDLRKCNWMPRGGEKGPKTIEEVREEVEQEQQQNELERIEHEKQKDKDRLQPQRKSSGRTNYAGRSSADRRSAAAASSLISRESKTESRISGTSRLGDLDKLPMVARKVWGSSHRDRTPQKDELSASNTGGNDAWRSTKSGTDSPKEQE